MGSVPLLTLRVCASRSRRGQKAPMVLFALFAVFALSPGSPPLEASAAALSLFSFIYLLTKAGGNLLITLILYELGMLGALLATSLGGVPRSTLNLFLFFMAVLAVEASLGMSLLVKVARLPSGWLPSAPSL